jgi:two-component system sensor histidine kinase KdpD
MADAERPGRDDREGRPDPDKLLAELKAQEAPVRGRLRIYLGMAPGVGKTYAMLHEGRRRKGRGTDVVVGFVETHGRKLTAEAIGDLEVVPRLQVEHSGIVLEEMDAEAVIARKPQVALVDELAHTNAPGSRFEKRWQDVELIRDAGVHVISTVNIQHLESLNDIVERITGVRVRETVPDHVIDEADEIEIVDMSPEALRARLRHGNVYPPEQAARAADNFFRAGNLAALRELALRRVAQEVDEQLERYMLGHQLEGWETDERIAVLVDQSAHALVLLRKGWRLAAGLNGKLYAVTIDEGRLDANAGRDLARNLHVAEDLGAEIVRLAGDRLEAIAVFVRANRINHIVLGQSPSRLPVRLSAPLSERLVRRLPEVELHICATPN